MLLVVVTLLIAPIHLPIMMKFIAGETIQIDVKGMILTLLYMNIGLDIVIASEFFSSQVLLFCIILELPINTLPVAIKRFTRNYKPNPSVKTNDSGKR